MKNKTQAKMADWAATFGFASAVLPLLGLLALGGPSSSTFWLKCAGLAALAVVALWMLHKSGKEDYGHRRFAWVLGLVYFGTVLAAVAQFFESLQMTLIFGAPEAAGAVLCLAGLFHSLRTPDVPEEKNA